MKHARLHDAMLYTEDAIPGYGILHLMETIYVPVKVDEHIGATLAFFAGAHDQQRHMIVYYDYAVARRFISASYALQQAKEPKTDNKTDNKTQK